MKPFARFKMIKRFGSYRAPCWLFPRCVLVRTYSPNLFPRRVLPPPQSPQSPQTPHLLSRWSNPPKVFTLN